MQYPVGHSTGGIVNGEERQELGPAPPVRNDAVMCQTGLDMPSLLLLASPHDFLNTNLSAIYS